MLINNNNDDYDNISSGVTIFSSPPERHACTKFQFHSGFIKIISFGTQLRVFPLVFAELQFFCSRHKPYLEHQ